MSRGFLKKVALVALVIGVGKLFRHRAWKMMHESADGSEAKHKRPFGGHKPPWFRRWEKPADEGDAASMAA